MQPKSLFILIVDNATGFAECAADILSERGCEVEVAEDGEGGLLAIEEQKPSLIIIDSNLPGIRGEKTIEIIRRKYQRLPIIGISAEDRAIQMRDAGATTFLKKPFEIPELLSTISELLPTFTNQAQGKH
jgi:DNA-binding response OmpR family regulator